ncbi:hypothetical protein BRADI_5g02265v3 [Brachypodium distachyon]|uniref:Uncharacterized protein n=1 Tax=Brachypodium distachyon TaxID=15368 RepID=A0A2K2CF10_BRADI|nr:hypothetical protein BRADI_5g02265v3 [Brachypodium distachyon]
MGSCASRPRGFPKGEKPEVVDTPVSPKASAPVVMDKYAVIEAPLVNLSTPKAEDTKVNEELIPGISELPIPMVEDDDKNDREAIVIIKEVPVAAESQN